MSKVTLELDDQIVNAQVRKKKGRGEDYGCDTKYKVLEQPYKY